jgi:pyruvate/2-oxoglutarate dehydrogenase complex dihydrolipoamide dehydrogenase (E3) component
MTAILTPIERDSVLHQMQQANQLVEPLDVHNRALLANVHPPEWVNPRPKDRYHLVVIGSGTGGLVTAAIAAGLGARVALIERHLMGGDCLNVGCVPSKGVIRAARAWHAARRAQADFGGPAVTGPGDFAAAMERMRRIRAHISAVDGAPRYSSLGIDVFIGQGTFTGPDRVAVGDATLRFRRAVIAAGARAASIPVPGLTDVGFRTNENIFWLTELPRRLVVIGAGPIGCEMAQAFARLGSQVTLIDRGAHILPREDTDAARIVERQMGKDGVTFAFEASPVRAERDGTAKAVIYAKDGTEHRVVADEILVAAGRAPNVEGLGLEAAGVAYERKGVTVDERLRTSNPRVYAVGDVASKYQFTHAADFQARMVVQNALFFGRGRASSLLIPWATYTSPEVAHVGLYARDAEAKGIALDTIDLPLHENDRSLLEGDDEGFVRVHLEKGTDKILGATIVAEHAGDMISEFTVAMVNRLGLAKIGAAIHPYPTQADAIRRTADLWRRTKLTPTVKKLFRRYFALLG